MIWYDSGAKHRISCSLPKAVTKASIDFLLVSPFDWCTSHGGALGGSCNFVICECLTKAWTEAQEDGIWCQVFAIDKVSRRPCMNDNADFCSIRLVSDVCLPPNEQPSPGTLVNSRRLVRAIRRRRSPWS